MHALARRDRPAASHRSSARPRQPGPRRGDRVLSRAGGREEPGARPEPGRRAAAGAAGVRVAGHRQGRLPRGVGVPGRREPGARRAPRPSRAGAVARLHGDGAADPRGRHRGDDAGVRGGVGAVAAPPPLPGGGSARRRRGGTRAGSAGGRRPASLLLRVAQRGRLARRSRRYCVLVPRRESHATRRTGARRHPDGDRGVLSAADQRAVPSRSRFRGRGRRAWLRGRRRAEPRVLDAAFCRRPVGGGRAAPSRRPARGGRGRGPGRLQLPRQRPRGRVPPAHVPSDRLGRRPADLHGGGTRHRATGPRAVRRERRRGARRRAAAGRRHVLFRPRDVLRRVRDDPRRAPGTVPPRATRGRRPWPGVAAVGRDCPAAAHRMRERGEPAGHSDPRTPAGAGRTPDDGRHAKARGRATPDRDAGSGRAGRDRRTRRARTGHGRSAGAGRGHRTVRGHDPARRRDPRLRRRHGHADVPGQRRRGPRVVAAFPAPRGGRPAEWGRGTASPAAERAAQRTGGTDPGPARQRRTAADEPDAADRDRGGVR